LPSCTLLHFLREAAAAAVCVMEVVASIGSARLFSPHQRMLRQGAGVAANVGARGSSPPTFSNEISRTRCFMLFVVSVYAMCFH
jgi:hypothetical protein